MATCSSYDSTHTRRGTRTASGLVEVHVDALQLQVAVTVVRAGWVNAVLIAHHLPELGANLVAALATLDVHDLTHS
jgi:hypothetical protein